VKAVLTIPVPCRAVSGWQAGGVQRDWHGSVLDADDDCCAGTATAVAQFFDQLGHRVQPGGALRVAEDETAAVAA
jgi:hypothetical protein